MSHNRAKNRVASVTNDSLLSEVFYCLSQMKQLLLYAGVAAALVLTFGLYFWLVPWLLSLDNLLAIGLALVLCLTPAVAAASFFISKNFKE